MLRNGARSGELASLLGQLDEKKNEVERLLARVEDVLRGAKMPRKTSRRAEPDATRVARARKSPLDHVKAVIESTGDLREMNGNLSAVRLAKVFGVSLSQLASWLGRSKQAVSKTPDANSLQEALGYFERVARLRLITKGDAEFRKWLRTPHELLESESPLQVLGEGEWQAMADYVDDILSGTPG